MCHIFELSPLTLDQVVDYLDNADLQSLILTCQVMCEGLRHHLWRHVHVNTISSKSSYTNTEMRPYKDAHCKKVCRPFENKFAFEHQCQRRCVRIDEHNLAEICVGMLRDGYRDAFSRIETLTFDVPVMFPEPKYVPVTVREMMRVDFGSLVNWFVEHLDANIFMDLQRLEITAVELAVELETPLATSLVNKFSPHGVDVAIFANLQDQWAVRQPIKHALVSSTTKILRLECESLDDAFAMCNNKPLPSSVQRLELRVSCNFYDAAQLRQFLAAANKLTELSLFGDVVNPTGINWMPNSVRKFQARECKTRLPPVVANPMYCSSITHLHVDLRSGAIFEQLQLPCLRSLWITLSFSEFYAQHFDTAAKLMKSSIKIQQLRMQGIPYDQVARLMSFGGCDAVESLTLEYAGFTSGNQQFTNKLIRKGAARVARECFRIRTLNIDLLIPKTERVIQVLREFINFCPNLNRILACVRDRYQPWLADYTAPNVLDICDTIDLGSKKWASVDIPQFNDKFLQDTSERDTINEIAADQSLAAALMFLNANQEIALKQ